MKTTVCPRRRGVALLEFSLAFPVIVTMVVGLVLLGVGVFQYQMVALLAREGARWASVRGTEYSQASGKPAASATDIYTAAILPKAVGMDLNSLTYSVAWSTNNQPGSTVKVTVNYRWASLGFLAPITLSSTSAMTVSY